jgi:DNA-binding XRE family transcriptional regulator
MMTIVLENDTAHTHIRRVDPYLEICTSICRSVEVKGEMQRDVTPCRTGHFQVARPSAKRENQHHCATLQLLFEQDIQVEQACFRSIGHTLMQRGFFLLEKTPGSRTHGACVLFFFFFLEIRAFGGRVRKVWT